MHAPASTKSPVMDDGDELESYEGVRWASMDGGTGVRKTKDSRMV